MKLLLMSFLLSVTLNTGYALTPVSNRVTAHEKEISEAISPGKLTLSFDFTQGGMASSQYAVWIENKQGKLVKTIYVTDFTAQGGYSKRKECLPLWVKKANPETLSANEIDAFTGATPRSGTLTYGWDGRDDKGILLPEGEYRFFIEGTLFWASRVLFSGTVQTGEKEQADIPVKVRYFENGNTNKEMIRHVKASFQKIK